MMMDDIFFEDPIKCSDCKKKFESGLAVWINGKCICPKCYDRHKNTAIQLADIYQEGDSNGTV